MRKAEHIMKRLVLVSVAALSFAACGGSDELAATATEGDEFCRLAQIAKDGTLAGLKDHLMTGFKPWDDAAIAAVKGAVPFAPLPKTWAYPTMEVHFHFEVVAK